MTNNTEIMLTGNVSLANYKSAKLREATERICALNDKKHAVDYEILSIIARVSKEESFRPDFKNVHEWTMTAFGFKRAYSYALLKIATELCTPIFNEKGRKIGVMSRIKGKNAVDFTPTQLFQLTTVPLDVLNEWVENDTISPTMSCRDLNKVVKTWKSSKRLDDKKTAETAETAESAENTESAENPETPETDETTESTITEEQALVILKTVFENQIKRYATFDTEKARAILTMLKDTYEGICEVYED